MTDKETILKLEHDLDNCRAQLRAKMKYISALEQEIWLLKQENKKTR